jgi:hypothetical protein
LPTRLNPEFTANDNQLFNKPFPEGFFIAHVKMATLTGSCMIWTTVGQSTALIDDHKYLVIRDKGNFTAKFKSWHRFRFSVSRSYSTEYADKQ